MSLDVLYHHVVGVHSEGVIYSGVILFHLILACANKPNEFVLHVLQSLPYGSAYIHDFGFAFVEILQDVMLVWVFAVYLEVILHHAVEALDAD